MTLNRQDRLHRIRQLLTVEALSSQDDLARRLESEGFSVTQSSVSRDLRELGVAKIQGIYRLAAETESNGAPTPEFPAELISNVTAAGPNLLVIHTVIGGAQRIGLAIDRTTWPEVVGTVAGDDTVFLATSDRESQMKIQRRLQSCIRQGRDHG